MNVFALIDHAIILRRKVLMNINVLYYYRVWRFLIKRLEMFKKRIKSELKIIVRDILFK